MKSLSRLVLVILLAAFSLSAQTLNEQQWQKLHPEFQSIVSESAPTGLLKSSAAGRTSSGQNREGVALYDAIIYTNDAASVRASGVHVNSSWPGFVTAQVTAGDLLSLAALAPVSYLDPGSTNYLQTDVSVPEIGVTLLHQGFVNATPYRGLGTIVLIYDTGIDWSHIDFRSLANWTQTRILYIWDQTLTAISGESPPSGFSYGVEYTKAQIDDENDGTPTFAVRERDINGHGTHVAGTAAGSGLTLNKYTGVAPQADIIIVKGGDGSFSETRMIEGLTYAQNKAASLGKPIVVNWSIGGQSGPHDGTRAYEVAVNNFVSTPGRVVCIAAGNDGANLIHFGGSISTSGSSAVTVAVPTYTPVSGSGNDRFILEIWFNNNATVTSAVTFNGSPTSPSNGSVSLSNAISSLNFNRNVSLDVSDAAGTAPAVGTWTVTLSNPSSNITFDAWLSFRTMGATLNGADNNKSVSMPATAQGAITVGSYVTKWRWPTYDGRTFIYNGNDRTKNISTFSGIGPTGDGRQKPDLAAPGQGISAALSSSVDTNGIGTVIQPGIKHYLIQGTSMATPHVAGVSALMLGAKPTLTASEVKSHLTSTARTDAFTTGVPNTTWGYGKIDAYQAVAKAVGVTTGSTRANLTYASSSMFFIFLPGTGTTPNLKFATRFTPTVSGKVSGASFTMNSGPSAVKGTGSLRVSLAQNAAGSVAGIPGTAIGGNVTVPISSLTPGGSNFVELSPLNVNVASGTDFHVVWEVVGGAGDTLQFLLDDGTTTPTDRSSSYRVGVNGLGWYNRADANYAAGKTPSFENFLITAYIAATVSDVELVSAEIPREFMLHQNFPNPFNPSTRISYSVSERGRVQLRVFDVLGRNVATLVDAMQSPGTYEAQWDLANGSLPIASGVYFYRLEQGTRSRSQKMVLLK